MRNDHDEDIKTRTMANDLLLPAFIAQLQANPGEAYSLPLRGNSMRPFLKDGRDKALLTLPSALSVGDAVLAFVDQRRYVLHRIVAIDGDSVTLRGDGNTHTEHCTLDDVKAVALGFFRKGSHRLDSTSSPKWRLYSWLWCRLLPVRRYLLFALSPHWPQRFRTTKKQKQ